jgi:hypothetical protein
MIAASPERAVERLQRRVSDSYDFGQPEITEVAAGHARVVVHQVPQPLGSLFLATLHGHAGVLIGSAGGKQVKLGGRLMPVGRRDEIGLVDVRVELDWSR